MFLRNVVRQSLKNQKKKKNRKSAADATPTPAIVEPVYYEEPASNSVESSEVEFIEDDDDYVPVASVDGARVEEALAQRSASRQNDEILALSVSVPSNMKCSDDDSCLSQEGILTRLPRYLVEKNRLSAKMDMGPSLTGSTTSEEHLTQVTASASENTCSETCSTSLSSDQNETKEKKKLETWRQSMEEHIDGLEDADPQAAASLLELGTLYLQCEDFEKAKEYFGRAVAVSEAVFEMPDLRIARALELYGIVESANVSSKQEKEQLDCAMSCLDTAFAIRYELQGPVHIDTVETLNRIARVQLKQKMFADAKGSYYEVFKLREAIFGSFHPCVAITARALAITHTRLYQADAARYYFQAALNIYERNGLGEKSFADVVRKDLCDLKRMKMRCEV